MAKATLAELRAELARREQTETTGESPLSAALIATGKGVHDIGNVFKSGFNTITGDSEAQAELEARKAGDAKLFAPLSNEFPISTTIGEIAGETVAALPLGLGAGKLVAQGTKSLAPLAQRLLSSGAAGAVEGGLVAASEDQAAGGALVGGGVAVAAELLFPKIGSVLKRVFRNPNIQIENIVQVADGVPIPSQSLTDELAKVGLTFDDITAQAVREIPQGGNPAEVARDQLFKSQNIPAAARSRTSQNPDDFQRELQLVRQRGVGESDKAVIADFRNRFFDESEAIQKNLTNLSEKLGDPSDAGVVKKALSSLNSNIQSAKVQAYKELGELAKENPDIVSAIPVQTDNVLNAASGVQKFLSNDMANKVDEVLAEFGLIGEAGQRQGRFTPVSFGDGDSVNIRGEIKSLNIGTLEDFRKQFNDIFDPSVPKEAAAKAQIINAIDDSSNLLVDGIGTNFVSDGIIKAANKARGIAREQKLLFSQKDLIDDLTRNKPGTVTPVVEASKSLTKIQGAPLEQQTRLIKTLQKSPNGSDAIKNLQAAKVVQLLENATENSSKLVRDGAEPISDFNGKKFRKDMNKEANFIKSLFADNKEALSHLNQIKNIGELRLTPEVAAQKGSAPDLVNSLLRSIETGSSKVPLVGGAVEEAASKQLAKSEVKNLTNLSPTQDTIEDFIFFNAPRLAANIGLSGAIVSEASE